MDPIITTATIGFASAFTGSAINKAEGPGRALDDIMTLIGFDKLHEVAEKKRINREQNIQSYKESIAQKISAIPEENIKEPPLSIVGPALEASKFYIEEHELREMFSSVISASMDSSLDNKVHPSFVDIIKQLSPHDALVLSKIKEDYSHVGGAIPAMKMIIKVENGEKVIFPLIVLFKNDLIFELNAISINNLSRLGIINIDMNMWSTDESKYTRYFDNPILKHVINQNPEMSLSKGSFVLNDFGKNFIDICVN